MPVVRHRFINHQINPNTEILILGTFNPDTSENTANFFYGRTRNYLWKLLPTAYNLPSLKNSPLDQKLQFIEFFKIDFIDLIAEVNVEEVANYYDGYIDTRVSQWRPIEQELTTLPNLKKIGFTRKTFGDIRNMKVKIGSLQLFCNERGIEFHLLPTPARFYSLEKQNEWNNFLRGN